MEIREMERAELDAVAAVMAEAFANDGLYRYFIEDEVRRTAFLRKFMRFRLRYGLAHGRVFVTDDGKGVAVWLAPGHTMTPWDLLRFGGLGAMRLCGKEERQRIMDFNRFADALAAAHAPGAHWHLSPICVDPAFQGRGCGRALVEHGLGRVGGSCCLETQSLENVRFYEARGFRVLGSERVSDTDLPHTVMLWP